MSIKSRPLIFLVSMVATFILCYVYAFLVSTSIVTLRWISVSAVNELVKIPVILIPTVYIAYLIIFLGHYYYAHVYKTGAVKRSLISSFIIVTIASLFSTAGSLAFTVFMLLKIVPIAALGGYTGDCIINKQITWSTFIGKKRDAIMNYSYYLIQINFILSIIFTYIYSINIAGIILLKKSHPMIILRMMPWVLREIAGSVLGFTPLIMVVISLMLLFEKSMRKKKFATIGMWLICIIMIGIQAIGVAFSYSFK